MAGGDMKRIGIVLWLGACCALLPGCGTPGGTPQRSDLFQLNNDAQLAYEKGEDARAEQLYMGLARAAPADPEIWLRLGNLYARSERPDAAAEAYQRALALKGNETRAWYNLGIVRLRQGWAAMMRANAMLKETDPLYQETERMMSHLGMLPELGAKPPAGGGADAREAGR
jgi:tetratricopeptide (TPR) repeat protein